MGRLWPASGCNEGFGEPQRGQGVEPMFRVLGTKLLKADCVSSERFQQTLNFLKKNLVF